MPDSSNLPCAAYLCAEVASFESTSVATSQPLSSMPIVAKITEHATPTLVVKCTRSAILGPRRICDFKDDEGRT